MKHILILTVFALGLTACAGTAGRKTSAAGGGPRPDWADGAAADYPRARFLTGAASADDPETAKDRARGEIAKVFSAKISVNSYASASEQTSSRQGAATTSSAQDVMQTVRTTSQKMLEGVEIVRAWRDPATFQYYSLAVLDRAKARATLEVKLSELDDRAAGFYAALPKAADKMEKARLALRLRAIFSAREALVADIRVLNPGDAAAAPFDLNTARNAVAEALAALDVKITVTPAGRERVEAEIAKTLNSLGIQVLTSRGAADIEVECSALLEAMQDTDPNSRWKWQRGTASVALKDVKAAKTFTSVNVTAKEAAASDQEALAKAETSLGRKIGAEISRGINSYFENQ